MLQYIFLLSDSGEVMLEKQLTGHRVDRSICAWFWDQIISHGDSLKLVPVIASLTHYLFQAVREGITFLACTQVEMPPLMAIEFLSRVADVLSDYLGSLNEDLIKDNFVTVYEVLALPLQHRPLFPGFYMPIYVKMNYWNEEGIPLQKRFSLHLGFGQPPL